MKLSKERATGGEAPVILPLPIDSEARFAHNIGLRQGSCIEPQGMMNSCGDIRAIMHLPQLAADIAVIECQIRSMFEKKFEVVDIRGMARLLLNVGADE